MKKSLVLAGSAATLAALTLLGCSSMSDESAAAASKDTVVAIYSGTAPNMALARATRYGRMRAR